MSFVFEVYRYSFRYFFYENGTLIINLRRIYEYSTAHTIDSTFIIGGGETREIIARFKDKQWKRMQNLKFPRALHGSITIGGQVIITGGGYFQTMYEYFVKCPAIIT